MKANYYNIVNKIYFFPFFIFAIPFGLKNDGIMALAGLSLAPLLFILMGKRGYFILGVIFYVIVLSLLRSSESNVLALFQFLRTGIPFLTFTIILYSFGYLSNFFNIKIRKSKISLLFLFRFLIIGQAFQVLLYQLGVNMGNVTFTASEALNISSGTARLFFFPGMALLFLLKYFMENDKIIESIITVSIIFLTGSKVFFACVILIMWISLFGSKGAFKKASVILVILFIGYLVNPLAFNRISDFFYINNASDATRLFQVEQVLRKINIDLSHLFFGYGFTVPLYDGIVTIDPGWAQNSKYDVENGYVMLAGKLGLLGVLLISILLYKLKRFNNGILTILLLLIFSISSGAALFGFEGVYLLLFSALLETRNVVKKTALDKY